LQELPKLSFLKNQKTPCSHTLKKETVFLITGNQQEEVRRKKKIFSKCFLKSEKFFGGKK
jgi:hypothetical protein